VKASKRVAYSGDVSGRAGKFLHAPETTGVGVGAGVAVAVGDGVAITGGVLPLPLHPAMIHGANRRKMKASEAFTLPIVREFFVLATLFFLRNPFVGRVVGDDHNVSLRLSAQDLRNCGFITTIWMICKQNNLSDFEGLLGGVHKGAHRAVRT
jgi:hypothetical protein